MTGWEAEAGGSVYSVAQSDGLGAEAWGVINVPLVQDRLALRVAAGFVDDPGFVDYRYVVREPGVSNPNAPFDGSGDDVSANLRVYTRDDSGNSEPMPCHRRPFSEPGKSLHPTVRS